MSLCCDLPLVYVWNHLNTSTYCTSLTPLDNAARLIQQQYNIKIPALLLIGFFQILPRDTYICPLLPPTSPLHYPLPLHSVVLPHSKHNAMMWGMDQKIKMGGGGKGETTQTTEDLVAMTLHVDKKAQ